MDEDQKDYGWVFFKDNWYRVSMSRGFRFESIEDVIHEELQPCEYFKQYGEPRPRRKGACPPNCLVKKSKGASCCLLYTSPSPRDATLSRMPSSA